jgi:hypothetical protein
MSAPLTIPRLEMAMTEGVLAKWLVDDGAGALSPANEIDGLSSSGRLVGSLRA